MRPRALPTLTAFVATATLTLTACGSSEDSSASDDIPGATDDGNSSTSPSPSDSAKKNNGKRPQIKLPQDLTYEFEWGNTGNKKKDAVLNDTEQMIKAVDMAIVKQDTSHEAYLFYTEGDAAYASEKWIKEYIHYNDRITGNRRFYSATVTIESETSASIVYCEDQSESNNKNIKTGKVDKRPTTEDSYVAYSSQMHLNEENVWITKTINSQRGAASCLP